MAILVEITDGHVNGGVVASAKGSTWTKFARAVVEEKEIGTSTADGQDVDVPVAVEIGQLQAANTCYGSEWGAFVELPLAVVQKNSVGRTIISNRDVEITITLVGYDEDTPGGLAFVIADSTAHGSLVTTGGATYSYTPDTDYNGSDSFTYNVFDGEMYSELATVSISITPINDAPILADLAPQEMDEDGGDLTLTLSATDVDNSELVFSAISDNEAVAVSIDGNTLTISPDPDHFGNAVITVIVSDSILTDSDTLALTINSVNDPPVVAGPIADVIMAEDSPDLTLAFLDTVFKDVDDSNLTFSYDNSNPDLLTVSIDGENVVTVTLKPDSNGTATLTFTATDDNLVTITDEVVITVTPVNDASQLTVIDTPQFGFQTNENEDLDISLTVDDIEFDAVEITVVSGPFHGTYDDTPATDTVVLTYSPNPGFFGNDANI